MRENKFRHYTKDSVGRYAICGDQIELTNIGAHEAHCSLGIWVEWTGLKDNNGEKIYEGDIVKLDQWEPSIAEVVFNRGGFCFRFQKDDQYYLDGKYLEGGEVIGNIYENPELLLRINNHPI